MLPMQDTPSIQTRALPSIALFFEPENHRELLAFATDGQELLDEIPFQSNDPKVLREKATETVKRLGASMKSLTFKQVHPDWVAEKLKNEHPGLAGVILRNLPPDQARHVLERLPEALLKSLPSIGETFAMDRELNDLVIRLFNSQLGLQEVTNENQGVHGALAKMNGALLLHFFRELGLKELALALSSLGESAVAMVLGRMTAADAELITKRISHMQRVPELRHKQAQANVLGVDVAKGETELFITAVGLSMYSKSLVEESMPLHCLIRLKLPRSLVQMLDRFTTHSAQPSLALRYQKDMLEVLKILKH